MNKTFERIQNGLEKMSESKSASLISGIVCAIPFVFEQTFFLSFIMYIPLFYLFLNNEKKMSIYLRVFLYAFGFYLSGYSFLCELYPLDFAGLTPFEAVGVIAFALTAVPSIHAGILTACFALCRSLSKNSVYAVKIAVFPCVIVFCEYLQTIGPLAFPWCRVSIAQSSFLPFVQSASLFGSYFTAYIVLLINALLAYSIMNKSLRRIMTAAAIAVFAVNTAFGCIRLSLNKEAGEKITAIALQGNMSSSEKWSGSVSEMVDVYISLSDKALLYAKENGLPDETVVLVPETAIPVTITEKSKYKTLFSDYADKNNISFAVGAFNIVDGISANSVFMFDEEGTMHKPYNKRIRVPFGEYLPYREVFTAIVPALAEINMLSEDLYEGKEPVVFETSAGKTTPVICYESVFPSVCRASVNKGAEILLVSTNDSWFGTSAALKHHLAASRIRAIENNVPVIRAANTGVSAIINADGTISDILGAEKRGYAVSEVSKGAGNTLYSVMGDVFVLICLVLTVLRCVIDKCKKK